AWVECPDVSPLAFTSTTQVSGIGSESDPTIFQVSVTNTNGVLGGSYPALVTVRDSRDGQTLSVDGISPSLGFTNDARAYRVVNVNVYDPTTFKPITTPNLVNFDIGTQHGAVPYANAGPGADDLAVFSDASGVGGVLIPNPTSSKILRFALDYSSSTTYASGVKPFDDYLSNPHPSPATEMPIKSIDAADDGSFLITFDDDNFTYDPNGLPGSILTRPLPMSDFATYFDNDNGVLLPAPRFIGGCGSGGTIPAPTFGERIRAVWDDPGSAGFNSSLGFLTGGENTERCNTSLDFYVFGSPYLSTAQKQISGNANILFDVPAASWFAAFKSMDAGTVQAGSQYYYALVGDEIYKFNAREGLDANRVGHPASFVKRTVRDSLADVSLQTVDIQVLEYNPAIARNYNGIGQNSDWIVVLLRDIGNGQGVIRIYDDTITLLDELDGRGAPGDMDFPVTSLDVDDHNYTIHVAMDDNGPAANGEYVVTVYQLLP
ncbi:MAG: hypothetical protein ABI743_06180, partial [bacterium]